MSSTAKAVAVARQLEEEYKIRLSALSVVVTFGSAGDPLIQVGTGAPGAAGALIRVKPISWPLAKDIFGQSAIQYGPHVLQIATEDVFGDINTSQQCLSLLGPLLQKGMKVEWYVVANGLGGGTLDEADFGGTLTASFEASLQYPMVQSQ